MDSPKFFQIGERLDGRSSLMLLTMLPSTHATARVMMATTKPIAKAPVIQPPFDRRVRNDYPCFGGANRVRRFDAPGLRDGPVLGGRVRTAGVHDVRLPGRDVP